MDERREGLLEVDTFHSTSEQMANFPNSPMWQDIRILLESWIKYTQGQLELSKNEIDMYRMQGQLKELRTLIGLPEVLAEEIASVEERKLNELKKEEE